MIEDSASLPLFKKIDRALFERLDKFKTTTNYNLLQDFYNGLEEEQQKVFKGLIILFIFLLPSMGLGFLWWQNNSLKSELDMRVSIVAKANEIIGQNQGLRQVSPLILSQSPIDSSSMMTSRLSGLLSPIGIDLGKIQVKDFTADPISSGIMRAEADFGFTNLSTDELMNIFTAMIQREKFRIQSVEIKRNPETNLLAGQFHAIHYSAVTQVQEQE